MIIYKQTQRKKFSRSTQELVCLYRQNKNIKTFLYGDYQMMELKSLDLI